LLVDKLTNHIEIVFWRSIDGGITWRMQNPGLPYEWGENQNKFYVVQQIDSLNVVAIGDTGLIVRTFDGGNSWEKQDCHTHALLRDVHFSDSLNGIVCADDTSGNIFITTNGGRLWVPVPFGVSNPWQCYSYSAGKFRVFKFGYGPIYTTYDNWKTVDSTKPFFDDVSDPGKNYILIHCNFTGGDTIVAYGTTLQGGGLIARSTNAGTSWQKPLALLGVNFDYIYYMTSLDRDTVLAAGESINEFLLSTNRGETWSIEPLIVDSTYPVNICDGLAPTSDGHFVGIYQGILVREENIRSSVESYEKPGFDTYIYPNPTTSEVNILTAHATLPIHIVDMLGREVFQSIISAQGAQKVDVSMLARGIYEILIDINHKTTLAGKFVVIGAK
jgi:hypothetical protein